MLKMPEPQDACQGKPLTGSGTSPGENLVAVNKDEKGVEELKTALPSDMEMQSLDFSQLVSCLAWGITVK